MNKNQEFHSAGMISGTDIAEMVRISVAEVMELAPEHIDNSISFFDLGLDSMQIVTIKGRLERQLSIELSNYVGYEYPSVGELSAFLWGCICARPPEGVAA